MSSAKFDGYQSINQSINFIYSEIFVVQKTAVTWWAEQQGSRLKFALAAALNNAPTVHTVSKFFQLW